MPWRKHFTPKGPVGHLVLNYSMLGAIVDDDLRIHAHHEMPIDMWHTPYQGRRSADYHRRRRLSRWDWGREK